MVKRTSSSIIINGTARPINVTELITLSRKYLPTGMASGYKDKFVDEVIFRISDLEFDNLDTNGKSIEEYYFAACLAYANENSYSKLFNEEDDGNIFDYCGSEL